MWARLNTEVNLRIDGFLRVADSTWRSFDQGFGIVLWEVLTGGLLIRGRRNDQRMKLAVSLSVVLVPITQWLQLWLFYLKQKRKPS